MHYCLEWKEQNLLYLRERLRRVCRSVASNLERKNPLGYVTITQLVLFVHLQLWITEETQEKKLLTGNK